jgi:Icc-related predicted phosphoesterase
MATDCKKNKKLIDLIQAEADISIVAGEIGISTIQLFNWIKSTQEDSFEYKKNKYILMKIEERLQEALKERETLLEAAKIFANELKNI